MVNNDIVHLKKNKDQAISKKNQLDEANNRMNVTRDQIERYNNTLRPIIDRLNMIHEREVDITKLYTEKGVYRYFCLS